MRVLVAEDDLVVSRLIVGMLRGRGHEPTPVYDAMQVLMFAMRAPQPEVIVLDINMPGGTGVDALRKLKRSVRTATIPVIVLSGSEDTEMPSTVLALGAAEFLSKPVDREALLAAMERAAQG
jgi:CheY-like chemotaxis protein